jgi:hypothetical protein
MNFLDIKLQNEVQEKLLKKFPSNFYLTFNHKIFAKSSSTSQTFRNVKLYSHHRKAPSSREVMCKHEASNSVFV